MRQGINSVLELNFKQDEKVKVSPVGEVIGLDGRAFRIDGAALIASIEKNALDIALDENHSFGAALGWFNKDSFELRDGGIYASLSLNKTGEELIGSRAYRYLSPVFDMGENRRVIGLDSVGLVNRPNLLNNAINSKGEEEMDKEISELSAKIDAIGKQIEELSTNFAARDKAEDTAAQKSEANAKESTAAESEANAKESNAIVEKITALDGQVQKLNSLLGAFFGKKELQKNSASSLSDEQKKVASLLGLSEEEYIKGAK
ncbi:phage protease [uncultured Campylobacter sp.]|uniref:phage protease n=1 Tax=uncultured Campylobacter sp. TaxID=218934 RepID=UPI0026281EF2|nr:phage protease [uncultured Campylobacter sp.]